MQPKTIRSLKVVVGWRRAVWLFLATVVVVYIYDSLTTTTRRGIAHRQSATSSIAYRKFESVNDGRTANHHPFAAEAVKDRVRFQIY